MVSYLNPLIDLVRNVGESILELYLESTQFQVKAKSDASPLTQADIVADAELSAGLRKITPQIPIISEEQTPVPFAERSKWPQYWLIDPVDGTKEFIRHSGDFSINIALIENHQPIFGLVYIPVLKKIYYAIRGQGAFKQELQLKPVAIHSEKFSKKMRIVVGHGYKIEKLKMILSQFSEYEILTVGSSIKFCYLAEGRADFYPRMGITYEWDTAAGQIIVEEAGGAVVDFALQPLRYNAKDSLLNPNFLAVGDKDFLEQINKFRTGE